MNRSIEIWAAALVLTIAAIVFLIIVWTIAIAFLPSAFAYAIIATVAATVSVAVGRVVKWLAGA